MVSDRVGFTFEELKSSWREFFSVYDEHRHAVTEAIDARGEISCVVVSFGEIDRHHSGLAECLLERPLLALEAAEDAMKSLMPAGVSIELTMRIRDVPVTSQVTVESLRAFHLGRFVTLQGVLVKDTMQAPRLTEGAFQCLKCNHITRVLQDDVQTQEPMECNKDGGGCGTPDVPWILLTDESTFVTTQEIEVVDDIALTDGRRQPRRIRMYLDDDLIGKAVSGDYVRVTGVLQAKQKYAGNKKLNLFQMDIRVNHLEVVGEDQVDNQLTVEVEEEIRGIAGSEDVLEQVAACIAPTVLIHTTIRKALALQLFGGVWGRKTDGTIKRGSLNFLFFGDRSTAKSQVLRAMVALRWRGKYANATTATGPGLTAAATKVKSHFDSDSWTTEAGTVVLAHRGMAAIDEIDKADRAEQTVLNECMAQGRVKKISAGIDLDLPAQTDILAAGNPPHGRFDPFSTVMEQLNSVMDSTFSSRFDAIFIFRDIPDVDRDERIARTMIQGSRLVRVDGAPDGWTQISAEDPGEDSVVIDPPLEETLLKSYVAFARRTVFPFITKEVEDVLVAFYLKLRATVAVGPVREEGMEKISITARQLESLINLSEASARMRLSPVVEMRDVRVAQDIYQFWVTEACGEGMDIDVFEVGVSTAQRDRFLLIKNILREWQAKHSDGMPEEAIWERAKEMMLDPDQVMRDLEKMAKDGGAWDPLGNGRWVNTR